MKTLVLVCSLFVVGCGYSSKGNQTIAQVKKVHHNTPIVCDDYIDADFSLGVMRNGVGSMSHEDIVMYVPDENTADVLTKAAEDGSLVRVTYNEKRWRWCVDELMVTKVEVVK